MKVAVPIELMDKLKPELQEAELMYKLFDLVSDSLEEVNEYLSR